jgi:predicted RNA-binding protein with PUA-like domain
MKNYWLIKSGPSEYSWQQLQTDGKTDWTGVRNYAARNNLREMQKGDLAFFYHSNEGQELGLFTLPCVATPCRHESR